MMRADQLYKMISTLKQTGPESYLQECTVWQSLVICLGHGQFNSTCKAKCLSLPDVGTA